MRLAIVSGGRGWHVQDTLRAAAGLGHDAYVIDFAKLSAGIGHPPTPFAGADAVLVRTMPAGSLEQVVFRMDTLHAAAAVGVRVVNPPRAVETCVSKFLTSARLAAAGLPTPRTVVCQTPDAALQAFTELGGDVVIKPLFGAEGRGMLRVSDPDLAWRTVRAITQTAGVVYLQQFLNHDGWDARLFVLGNRVLAGMRRTVRTGWRTNIAQGGTASPFEADLETRTLALRAAAAVGATLAGVDLLLTPQGWTILEVNAVPGWRTLVATAEIDVATELVRYILTPNG